MSTMTSARKLAGLIGARDWLGTYEGDAGPLADNLDDETIPADLRDGYKILSSQISTLTREVGLIGLRLAIRKTEAGSQRSSRDVARLARKIADETPVMLRAAASEMLAGVTR